MGGAAAPGVNLQLKSAKSSIARSSGIIHGKCPRRRRKAALRPVDRGGQNARILDERHFCSTGGHPPSESASAMCALKVTSARKGPAGALQQQRRIWYPRCSVREGGFCMRCGTAFLALLLTVALISPTAAAGPALLFDAKSGTVLYAEDPDNPWHPASLAKLMTAYLTFEAIKSGTLGAHLEDQVLGRGERRAAEQDRIAGRTRAHGRPRPAGAHHQVGERRRRDAGRGRRRQRAPVRRQDE